MKLPLTFVIAALLALASGAGYFVFSEQTLQPINVAEESDHTHGEQRKRQATTVISTEPQTQPHDTASQAKLLIGSAKLQLPNHPHTKVRLDFIDSEDKHEEHVLVSDSEGYLDQSFESNSRRLVISLDEHQPIDRELPSIEYNGQIMDLGIIDPLKLYSYQGSIVRTDGNPVARAHLFLTMGSVQELYACTSFDGSFHFEDMVPDTYRNETKQTFKLEIRHSFFAPQLIKVQVENGVVKGPSEIVLTPGATLTGIVDLSSLSAIQYEQRSLSPALQAQQSSLVLDLRLMDSPGYHSSLERSVDVDLPSGSFRIERLPAGLYTAEVKWHGRRIMTRYNIEVPDNAVTDIRLPDEANLADAAKTPR